MNMRAREQREEKICNVASEDAVGLRVQQSNLQVKPHREVAGHDALPQVELQRTRMRSWPEFVATIPCFLDGRQTVFWRDLTPKTAVFVP